MKLMIVDDHAGVRDMIRRLLCGPGDAFCECGSGDEAVRLTPDFKPDYVTLDLHMPGMSPFDTARTIRKSHSKSQIVIVTSNDETSLRQAATEAGAIAYILKDRLMELRDVIKPAGPAGQSLPLPPGGPLLPQNNTAIDLHKSFHSPLIQLTAQVQELECWPGFVAHELQSPLQSIRRLLAAQSPAPDPSSTETARLRRIDELCALMHERIDAMLKFASFGGAPQFGRVQTHPLVHDCWSQATTPERRGRILFQMDRLPDVFGDRSLLGLAFTNLLDNAVKFTRAASRPEIEVNCSTVDKTAVFAIRDNGAGFDEKDAGKLFLPFGRLHSPHEYSGAGLGLALTRRIIQKHGGRIWAQAAPGSGATFYFTLPLPAAV